MKYEIGSIKARISTLYRTVNRMVFCILFLGIILLPEIVLSIPGPPPPPPPPPEPDIMAEDSILPADDLDMSFGNLMEGLSLRRVIRISNSGSAQLDIDQIVDPAQPFFIENDGCSWTGISSVPTDYCLLTVRFTPAAIGTFSSVIDIPSNDPDTAILRIALSGTGLSSALNHEPSVPPLLYPADGQAGLGVSVEFRWARSSDSDLDNITYRLIYSEAPEFIEISPVLLTSAVNGIYYASTGGWLLLFGTVFAGSACRQQKTVFLLSVCVMLALFSISCGSGGGSGAGTAVINNDTGSNEIAHSVTVSAGTTYYWKVIADDGNGGLIESEVRSFKTQ